MSFVVAHLGARRHYAEARMLYARGLLARHFTDICSAVGWPRLLHLLPSQLQPAPIRRLTDRMPQDLPSRLIDHFPGFGFGYAARRRQARSASELTAAHLWAGRRFCELIIARGLGQASGVYTYNTAGLELLRHARERGLSTVTDQTIAPSRIERRLLAEEQQAWPDWEAHAETDSFADDLSARERAEWELADVILCGSRFVRDGILAEGGPASRCCVVPYGATLSARRAPQVRNTDSLRILTVGAVGLRKGSPYVARAAALVGSGFEFRMIGPLSTSPKAQADLRRFVSAPGAIPRSQVQEQYEWADVFLLPSLCEGSAMACFEAMAQGLPIVTTHNTGTVVRHEIDGFIVPIRDPEAIAACLTQLREDPTRRQAMAQNAFDRAVEFTMETQTDAFVRAVTADGKPVSL